MPPRYEQVPQTPELDDPDHIWMEADLNALKKGEINSELFERVNEKAEALLAHRKFRNKQNEDEIPTQYVVGVSDGVAMYIQAASKFALLDGRQEEYDLNWLMHIGLSVEEMIEKDNIDEEQINLGEILVDKGRAAKNEFTTSNLRLVVGTAKKYSAPGQAIFEEHLSEGTLGLNRAVEKFDRKKGFKFSTYATWWIRQSITRYNANNRNPIRVPAHKVDQQITIENLRNEASQKGIRLTDEELAEQLGVSVKYFKELEHKRELVWHPSRLDAPVSHEEGDPATLKDFIAIDKDEESEIIADRLKEELMAIINNGNLKDNERLIIKHRYGLDGLDIATLEELGSVFGVTRERIRQIEKRALHKLGKHLGILAIGNEDGLIKEIPYKE